MNLEEYSRHDALGLAELVRRGEVSAAELEGTARRAMAAVNGLTNAVVGEVSQERGRAAVDPAAPFHGVPFLLKDIGHGHAGVACEMGSRLGKGYVVAEDSLFGARCKASGLVAVGRSNTPEFALSGTTEPFANGPTRNPWDLDRSAGGSSGGAGAAVASGVVPIAHGSDAGGSIRIPAAWCGLVGHKPTRGLVPKGPQASDLTVALSVNLVLTRTVRDTAAFMDAVCGPGIGDYVSVPKPARGWLASLGDPVPPLRVAVADALPGGLASEPEAVAAARAVAARLEAMGHHVEEATPQADVHEMQMVGYDLFLSRVEGFLKLLAAATGRQPGPDTLEAMTLANVREAKAMTIARLYEAFAILERITVVMDRFMERYDLLVMPAVSKAPYEIGFADPQRHEADGPSYWAKEMPYYAASALWNVTGHPALVIPPLEQRTPVPLGVQLSGRKNADGLLFRIAALLEQEACWQDRRPPVHVAG